MRTAVVVLAAALAGCGGSEAPMDPPAEKTPAPLSQAEVERAVVEQTGTVALNCHQDPDAPERWFCRQSEQETGWYAIVQPDGSVKLE